MMRTSIVVVAVAAWIGVVAQPLDRERQEGFEPLFAGGSLAGWQTLPLGKEPGTWWVRDGIVSYEPGDSWLSTERTFTDFVLRLEYRTTGLDSDSGIFLRAPTTGYPSFSGMELEIRGDDSGKTPGPRATSAIYGAVAPARLANRGPGEWNTVEVAVQGRRLIAIWNGVTVHDISLDDPAYAGALRGPLSGRAASGRIGFQAHLTGARVEFRNIRVKVIPPG